MDETPLAVLAAEDCREPYLDVELTTREGETIHMDSDTAAFLVSEAFGSVLERKAASMNDRQTALLDYTSRGHRLSFCELLKIQGQQRLKILGVALVNRG